MSNEVILINIYGEDKPWVTASVTEILGRYDAIILDVGQADIHHNLSLGFLVKLKMVSVYNYFPLHQTPENTKNDL